MPQRPLILPLLLALALSACGQQGADMSASSAEIFGSPQAAALYQAAARGEMERARELMAQGASPQTPNAKRQTLLKVAMLQGNRKAFDNLLALGADPAYLGQARDTPMHLAAKLPDPYWLKTMLAHGASTEVRNALGETPLFPALGSITQANVQLLLDAGADIHVRSNQQQTLLHEAALIGSSTDLWRFLELGVDPRAQDRRGATFQTYFFMGPPESQIGEEGKAFRNQVRAWLRSHNIPVEDAGAARP